MSTENAQKRLSEEQIDEIVIAQAKDDTAWEEPISVHRDTPDPKALTYTPTPLELNTSKTRSNNGL